MPNLSLITNQNNGNNLMIFHDELAVEASSRYHTEYVEERIKNVHDLLCKAHNKYNHELTYILPSEIALLI